MLKRIILKIFYGATIIVVFMRYWASRIRHPVVGLVLEEFFHQDLRGWGGYAMTAKNISDYYNTHPERGLGINVLLASKLPIAPKPRLEHFHNAKVLFRANQDKHPHWDLIRYLWCFSKSPSHILLSIEYYLTHHYVLKALPWIPVIIYLRDPRGKEEWERLGSLAMELKWRKVPSLEALITSMERENYCVREIVQLSKRQHRKIIFASNADFLSRRAKKAYDLPDINPYFLPNPLIIPEHNRWGLSVKPSIVFIGRLDPQKRIWIIFELAKRFKGVSFLIIGDTSASQGHILSPLINQYKHVTNLEFLGTLDGDHKWRAIGKSWGLINTSIHEGLPVTFLEALGMARPIISCLDPDGLTTRFGYHAGDILGEGTDKESLDKFSRQIELFLSDPKERREKGLAGCCYVKERHSFENFDRHLKKILMKEGLV